MNKTAMTRVLCAYETNMPGSAAEKLQQRGDLEGAESPDEQQASARTKDHWHELTTREQNAAVRLGWSAESWHANEAPSCGTEGWAAMSAEEQGAAVDLGYDHGSWQEDFVATPGSPVFGFDLESLPLRDLQVTCIEEAGCRSTTTSPSPPSSTSASSRLSTRKTSRAPCSDSFRMIGRTRTATFTVTPGAAMANRNLARSLVAHCS